MKKIDVERRERMSQEERSAVSGCLARCLKTKKECKREGPSRGMKVDGLRVERLLNSSIDESSKIQRLTSFTRTGFQVRDLRTLMMSRSWPLLSLA